MPWFKVDDGLNTSKKVLAIPRGVRVETMGLWTLCGVWSARELTDGRIPDYIPEELGGSLKQADELVRVDLWHAPGATCDHLHCGAANPGEYLMHDWLNYQPSGDDSRAKRADVSAKRSVAGKKGAAARWPSDSKSMANATQADGKGMASEKQDDGPVPDPYPVKTKDLSTVGERDRKPKALYSEAFEEWWKHYPRKESKGDALKAWETARKARTMPALAELIIAADAYACKVKGDDPKFVKLPAGWIRDRKWEDETAPAEGDGWGNLRSLGGAA
jgi:hypothetical protein